MNYGAIKYFDIANGAGVRTSLFVSGCTHCCKGCFQPETWDFGYGSEFTEKEESEIIESLRPDYVSGLAVLGGEPMEPSNQETLTPFLKRVKETFPNKTIWLYTGDTFETLIDAQSSRHTPYTDDMLACIDVMVDGQFIDSKKDITLRFRGSSNQRILDMPASLETGKPIPWQDQKVYSTHTM